jgi:hypothetical protein
LLGLAVGVDGGANMGKGRLLGGDEDVGAIEEEA